jgi:hypothetical protein
MSALNGKPGPGEKFPILRRCSVGGRWETISFAIERTDRTLRLCVIMLVTGSPLATELLAILIRR